MAHTSSTCAAGHGTECIPATEGATTGDTYGVIGIVTSEPIGNADGLHYHKYVSAWLWFNRTWGVLTECPSGHSRCFVENPHTTIDPFNGTRTYDTQNNGAITPDAVEVETQAATDIAYTSATLNGAIIADGDFDCEARSRYRLAYSSDEYTITDWANGLRITDTFAIPIGDLESNTEYEFAVQGRNSGHESDWGDTLYFTTLELEEVLPIHTDVEIVALEALRNIEMSAMGRIYVDEEGNLCYENRYSRQA